MTIINGSPAMLMVRRTIGFIPRPYAAHGGSDGPSVGRGSSVWPSPQSPWDLCQPGSRQCVCVCARALMSKPMSVLHERTQESL